MSDSSECSCVLGGLRAVVEAARAFREVIADERQLIAQVARSMADLAGGTVHVWLLPGSGGEPSCVSAARAHRGDAGSPPGELGSPEQDRPIVLRVLDSGEAVTVMNPLAAAHGPLDAVPPGTVPGAPSGISRRGDCGLAAFPLVARGRTLGVVVAAAEHPGDGYSEHDLAHLQALADLAAISVDSAKLLADTALALEETRQQNEVMDHISDVIIACGADNLVVGWNTAAERTYLYLRDDALGCDPQTLLATEFCDGDGEPVSFDQVLAELDEAGTWRGRLSERRADGELVELLSSLSAHTDDQGHRIGIVAVNRDVTEQRKKEREAHQDALTGLPNRRMLAAALKSSLSRSRRDGLCLAVLFLDLDGFKAVNDTLGHDAGDEVLRETTRRMLEVVRDGDMVARIGGDEFVVLAENVRGRDGAEIVARRLIGRIGEPMPVGDASAHVVPSIGIAMVEADDPNVYLPADLLHAADQAMYHAKQRHLGLSFAAGPEAGRSSTEQASSPAGPRRANA